MARDRVALVADALLLALAIALPWELFTRVPGVEFTVVKAFGGAIVVLAALRWSLDPRQTRLRCGLEGPVVLFFGASLLSYVFSADRAVTLGFLRVYAMYALAMYAAASLCGGPGQLRRLWTAYAVSAAVLALVSVACAAGVLAPTFARELHFTGERITPLQRLGVPMRMVAASEDLNGGALPFVIAFSIVLGALLSQGQSPLRARAALIVGGLLCVSGTVVAMSRSSLLAIAVTLAAIPVATRVARRARNDRPSVSLGWAVAIGVSAVAAAIAAYLLFPSYVHGFLSRAVKGFGSRDASYEGRLAALRAAFALLPSYGWHGCGLGASPQAIAASRFGEASGGVAIHSLPLKFWFETGIGGLAAFVWAAGALGARLWRTVSRAHDGPAACNATAGLAVLTSTLLVFLVQPFDYYSSFPILLGLLAASARNEQPAPAPRRMPAAVSLAAVAAIAGLVAYNEFRYQRAYRAVSSFAETLERGIREDERAQWTRARAHYEDALARAGSTDAPFGPVASRVVRLDTLYEDLGLGALSPVHARAVTAYALGRACAGAGTLDDAKRAFDRAAAVDAQFAEARLALAECQWQAGEYAAAIENYAAANSARVAGPALRERWLAYDARIEELRPSGGAPHALEALHVLRMRGRWTEAVELCQTLAGAGQVAEVDYLLGVDAEVRGDRPAAIAHYARAVEALPEHEAAARRLGALR